VVIVVDHGIASSAGMKAAIERLRQSIAPRLVADVPVAPRCRRDVRSWPQALRLNSEDRVFSSAFQPLVLVMG
jgi:hypothetical protein